jgi:uncharacterized protein (DUF433 family)
MSEELHESRHLFYQQRKKLSTILFFSASPNNFTFDFNHINMSDSLIDRITINPQVAHGKPTIRNKRYTVEGLLEYLAGGDSVEDLLKEFPDLEKEDFQACLQYGLLNMEQKYTEINAA